MSTTPEGPTEIGPGSYTIESGPPVTGGISMLTVSVPELLRQAARFIDMCDGAEVFEVDSPITHKAVAVFRAGGFPAMLRRRAEELDGIEAADRIHRAARRHRLAKLRPFAAVAYAAADAIGAHAHDVAAKLDRRFDFDEEDI